MTANQSPILYSIFVGQPKMITDERGTWTSSVCRVRIKRPVSLQRDGLTSDNMTQRYHGGPESAVCVQVN
jgi:MOSC domain-containing protein YiiM